VARLQKLDVSKSDFRSHVGVSRNGKKLQSRLDGRVCGPRMVPVFGHGPKRILVHFSTFPPIDVMIPRILLSLVAVASVLFMSCSPYPEHSGRGPKSGTKSTKPSAAQVEQAKQQAQQEDERRAEQEKRTQAQAEQPSAEQPKEHPTSLPDGPKLPEPKRFDYPTAKKVPGKEGVVLSPYNNMQVSIRNEDGTLIPSRTLVSDPTYPASEKKRFFVP